MLSWTTSQTNDRIIHSTQMMEPTEREVRQTLENCTDKAIALINTSIQDDSLYLLFEWNPAVSSLSIVVTDASKKHDSPESIFCIFSGVHNELAQADDAQQLIHIENVKFWLHDYLTTCSAFFRYSLVAIFHSSTRNNTELL